MTNDNLRELAEEKLKDRLDVIGSLSDTEVRKLAFELEVHQIELELQNEELRRTHEKLEESRTKYADLYDFSPTGYFTFDTFGMILAANLTGAGQLGLRRNRLIRKPFAGFLHKDDRDLYYLHIKKYS